MISNAELAAACGLTVETIEAWRNGYRNPPPYIKLTCMAIAKRRKPASLNRCRAIPELHKALGIEPQRVNYWRLADQWPLSARLAVAALSIRKPLSSHRKQVIRNINVAGTYFRTRNGYRARPVLGRPMPLIRLDTARALVHEKYARLEGDRLKLTDKGKREAYDK